MADTNPIAAQRRRIRSERIEIIADPEAQKIDLVAERIRLQKKQFINELTSRLGLIMLACKAMDISYETIRAWAKADPEFLQAISNVSEYTLDVVEQKLLLQITEEKDTTAMIFYLKTKGRNRGFGTRVELTGVDGGPIASEQTIRIADMQKEIPDDTLDDILELAIGNSMALQPVANTPPVVEAEVTKVTPHGYTIPEVDDEEEEEIE